MDNNSTEKKADKRPTMAKAVQVRTNDLSFDDRRAWLAFSCAALASLFSIGSCYSYGIFFSKILEEFKAGRAKTAMPGSFFIAFLTIMSPVGSVFATRFNCKISLICGSFLCAVGLVGSAFATNIYILTFTYGIVAAWGSCMVYMSGFQMIPLYFVKYRTSATAVFTASGFAAGVVIMGPIVQVLIAYLEWRRAMLVLAGINLASGTLGAGITRKIQPDIKDGTSISSKSKTLITNILASLHLSVLKDPNMIFIIVLNTLCYIGHYMPLIHLVNYAEEIGISSDKASWFLPIIGISSAVSRVLTGTVGDTGRITFYHTYQAGALLMVVACFLIPMAKSLGYLFAYAVVLGICEGLYFTSAICLAFKINPNYGIGWLFSVSAFTIFISPSFAGFIADSSDSYAPLFYTSGSFLLAAFLITPLHRCIKQPESVPCEIVLSDMTSLLVVERESVV